VTLLFLSLQGLGTTRGLSLPFLVTGGYFKLGMLRRVSVNVAFKVRYVDQLEKIEAVVLDAYISCCGVEAQQANVAVLNLPNEIPHRAFDECRHGPNLRDGADEFRPIGAAEQIVVVHFRSAPLSLSDLQRDDPPSEQRQGSCNKADDLPSFTHDTGGDRR
jgi:hypothetical protein